MRKYIGLWWRRGQEAENLSSPPPYPLIFVVQYKRRKKLLLLVQIKITHTNKAKANVNSFSLIKVEYIDILIELRAHEIQWKQLVMVEQMVSNR